MALVDADYKFLWVDVGADGSASDAQIFNHSELKEALEDASIGFPVADHLPNDDKNTCYFFLGDDAFALKTYIIEPLNHRNMTVEEKIFNYMLCRACVCLHNLVRMRYPGLQNAAMDAEDDNHQVADGAWRTGRNMQDVHNVRGPKRDTRAAIKAQREYLKHYFNSLAGSVPWQNNMVPS